MTNHYPDLANQVVFVTGAAQGIGAAQAEAFLNQQAVVFGVDLKLGRMEELATKYPEHFVPFIGDISQKEVIEKAVMTCRETVGTITILLNTAGILDDYKPLLETEETLWDRIYEVNVKSLFRLTKQVLPDMLEKQTGTIINMASIAGMVAGGGGIAYTSAKHAIIGFTKQLALDYAAQGIRVKAIAPGAIQTPMNAADFAGDGEMAKWVAEETPVKRWAQPEEVAELTLFLATPQASYIHGAVVPIDGGWLLK
ncbi:3-oxoacyl-ACP reductase [Enterococcus sp. DIV1298c]|uniref:3-oxoacyl-ACP reductase n=1 Tax=Candidatus Enterococcus mangumiae TaxID=2230878 RepID=A0ABZ2SW06_9ENTE|nr:MULTISPECIES: 3-oxoacyl-ACP reductase [unclassified Enterococcus]MBO0461475.1 3-oxoacyl-ACP reductase [Enterococcus sp. DIV1298c]MBO0489198.1 3-oxoacyl-ACP reductase [Enterococcus sp. DIV1094]